MKRERVAERSKKKGQKLELIKSGLCPFTTTLFQSEYSLFNRQCKACIHTACDRSLTFQIDGRKKKKKNRLQSYLRNLQGTFPVNRVLLITSNEWIMQTYHVSRLWFGVLLFPSFNPSFNEWYLTG